MQNNVTLLLLEIQNGWFEDEKFNVSSGEKQQQQQLFTGGIIIKPGNTAGYCVLLNVVQSGFGNMFLPSEFLSILIPMKGTAKPKSTETT